MRLCINQSLGVALCCLVGPCVVFRTVLVLPYTSEHRHCNVCCPEYLLFVCVLGCFATRPTGLLVSRYGWLVHIVLLCLPLVLVFPELHRMDYTSTMFEASELGSLCGHVVFKVVCVCVVDV